MKDNLKTILKDKLIKVSVVSSIFLIIIQTILVFVFAGSLPPLIPLLNSQPWGEARLYSSSLIFLIPVVFVVIFVVNNSLSVAFYNKNTLASRILSFNSFLFMILGFLAFVQIVFLVF